VKGRRSKYGFPVYIPLAALFCFDDFVPSSIKDAYQTFYFIADCRYAAWDGPDGAK
jgi:hypothetical protein